MNRLPNIRFNTEKDSDLIEWVQSIKALPNGMKGEVVKDVLRMGLNKQPKMRYQLPKVPKLVLTPSGEVSAPQAPKATRPAKQLEQLDISSLIEALRSEFLADIRHIVDASISQGLEGVNKSQQQTANQEAEACDILDSFADLMLE